MKPPVPKAKKANLFSCCLSKFIDLFYLEAKSVCPLVPVTTLNYFQNKKNCPSCGSDHIAYGIHLDEKRDFECFDCGNHVEWFGDGPLNRISGRPRYSLFYILFYKLYILLFDHCRTSSYSHFQLRDSFHHKIFRICVHCKVLETNQKD